MTDIQSPLKPSHTAGTDASAIPQISMLDRLYSRYRRFWPLLVVLLILTVTAAFFYIKYTVPQYGITAMIMLKEPDKNLTALQGQGTPSGPITTKDVDNEIAVLTSTPLIVNVIKDLHLYAPIFIKGKFFNRSAFLTCPVLIDSDQPDSLKEIDEVLFRYDAEKMEVTMAEKKYPLNSFISSPWGRIRFVPNPRFTHLAKSGNYFFSLVTVTTLLDNFTNALDVSTDPKKETSVITLKIKDEVPLRGEAILNDLIASYNKRSIHEKNIIAEGELKFVEDRLLKMGGQLDTIQGGIQRYKSSEGAVDMSEQSQQYLEAINSNQDKLSDLTTQFQVLDQIEQYLQLKNDDSSLAPSTFGIEDPLLPQMLTKLSDLKIQYTRLRKTTAENNPILSSLKNEIDQIKPNILDIIQNHRATLKVTKTNIESNTTKYNSLISSIPVKERKLVTISRQANTKSSIYNFLLQKREELEISIITATSDCAVLEAAESSRFPVSPKKILIYLIAIALAFLTMGAFIGIREYLNHKIFRRKELESIGSLPILAELSEDQNASALKMAENGKDFLSYQFRKLRAALLNEIELTGGKTVLVTSSVPDEGKTFVSANLALSIAQINKKVILVETDLHKPRISGLFNLKSKPGLSQFLMDKSALDKVIFKSELNDNLFLISAGEEVSNPSELLLSGRLSALLDSLKQEFDIVLMLGAPVVFSTDSYALNEYADKTLFIVREDFTDKRTLESLLHDSSFQTLKNLSVIYNDVHQTFKKKTWMANGYS